MTVHRANRLMSEQSPYLLQHGNNPVDWFPWGEEAFEKAKRENKPVFLSIGYSTCHWCHVMAEESFEDTDVARLMNEAFVSIKVDREERPDIDMVYMTVCQMLTGSGGWPLTIVMTPDKEPFFAGTYFPRDTRFGHIGLLDLIPRIQQRWLTQQGEVLNTVGQVKAALRQMASSPPGQGPGEAELDNAFEQLKERYDEKYAGFGNAPKFPSPHNMLFLLRYWKRSGNRKALDMVEKTLRSMRMGGIYDHLGFGFHRYSTDSRWLVPHFEKMLYDQALLARAFIETYLATGKDEYAATARQIFSYVMRDMRSPEGGFYSAEDADSEGEEGKFYLWSLSEIESLFPAWEAELAVRVFNVSGAGNYSGETGGGSTGLNILHLAKPAGEIASELNFSEADFLRQVESIREKLFACREKRVHPHKDDKILTDWNGLMIAALAEGARALGEPGYAEAAGRAADFILEKLRASDGRLLHRYRNGQAAVPANVDDYAFMIQGMVEMYETTFEVRYLRTAIELNGDLLAHFWDDENGGFFFIADDAENFLVRQKEIADGAIPSGNSVAMLNLLRLGRLTADAGLERKAAEIGQAFAESIRQVQVDHTQLMVAVDFAVGPSYEVVIAGEPGAEDTAGMISALRGRFIPNKVVVLRPAGEISPGIDEIAPFVSNHPAIDGKATAYVCLNYNCKLPVTDVETMLELLNGGGI